MEPASTPLLALQVRNGVSRLARHPPFSPSFAPTGSSCSGALLRCNVYNAGRVKGAFLLVTHFQFSYSISLELNFLELTHEYNFETVTFFEDRFGDRFLLPVKRHHGVVY